MSTQYSYPNHEPTSPGARKWRENWLIYIECKRCGACFGYTHPVIGTQRVPNKHQRTVTIYAPETCPECASLHAVEQPAPAPGLDVSPPPQAG